jgi:cobalamin biosynthesis protein CobT
MNCCVVSCPVASLRAEIRALRDNGVYGSSMVPYLQVLRTIFDLVEECAEDAEEVPAEFSESEESSDGDEDDTSDDDEDEDDASDDADAADADDASDADADDSDDARRRKRVKVEGISRTRARDSRPHADDDSRVASVRVGKERVATPATVFSNVDGASGYAVSKTAAAAAAAAEKSLASSAYQLEMRAKYKLFSRFLGTYFAKQHLESASVAGLASHPDAASFASSEIVAFLDMLQRENKVMLHEGTVMII